MDNLKSRSALPGLQLQFQVSLSEHILIPSSTFHRHGFPAFPVFHLGGSALLPCFQQTLPVSVRRLSALKFALSCLPEFQSYDSADCFQHLIWHCMFGTSDILIHRSHLLPLLTFLLAIPHRLHLHTGGTWPL